MTGRHRKPSPLGPLGPVIAGASVAAASLLIGTVVTAQAAPAKATAKVVPLPPVRLPMPLLSVANAAMYLTPIPVPAATEPTVLTAETAKATPFTVKATGSGLAARAVTTALGMRGVPYSWGGTSRSGVDCSGLTQLAFRSAGVMLPRTAAAQASVGRSVSLNQVQAGDLIFYNYGGGISHVVMAAGNGKIIEASQSGVPVREAPLYTNGLAAIRRIIG